MHISARLAIHSVPERRGRDRIAIDSAATIAGAGFNGADVVLRDISATGFRVVISSHLPPGSLVRLRVAGLGMAIGRIIWSRKGEAGGEFVNEVSETRLRSIVGYRAVATAA